MQTMDRIVEVALPKTEEVRIVRMGQARKAPFLPVQLLCSVGRSLHLEKLSLLSQQQHLLPPSFLNLLSKRGTV